LDVGRLTNALSQMYFAAETAARQYAQTASLMKSLCQLRRVNQSLYSTTDVGE